MRTIISMKKMSDYVISANGKQHKQLLRAYTIFEMLEAIDKKLREDDVEYIKVWEYKGQPANFIGETEPDFIFTKENIYG